MENCRASSSANASTPPQSFWLHSLSLGSLNQPRRVVCHFWEYHWCRSFSGAKFCSIVFEIVQRQAKHRHTPPAIYRESLIFFGENSWFSSFWSCSRIKSPPWLARCNLHSKHLRIIELNKAGTLLIPKVSGYFHSSEVNQKVNRFMIGNYRVLDFKKFFFFCPITSSRRLYRSQKSRRYESKFRLPPFE